MSGSSRGSTFGREDPTDCGGIQRVRAEAVHRLGRERDQAAGPQDRRGARDTSGVRMPRVERQDLGHRPASYLASMHIASGLVTASQTLARCRSPLRALMGRFPCLPIGEAVQPRADRR